MPPMPNEKIRLSTSGIAREIAFSLERIGPEIISTRRSELIAILHWQASARWMIVEVQT